MGYNWTDLPTVTHFFIPNKVSLEHLLISFPNNQPLLNSVLDVVLTFIVKQNCFWKNVVGESKTCVASINFYAGKRKTFVCLQCSYGLSNPIMVAILLL